MQRFLQAFFLLSMLCAQQLAAAQGFPTKPIKIIVPLASGGGADLMTRTMATALAERIGQPVVIENRGGAGGTVGMDVGARAPADGYTLTMVYQSMGVNPFLYAKLPFDTIKDFAPVSRMVNYQPVMVINNDVPAKSVAELIALAKAKPGTLTFGSSGAGGLGHLAMELFMSQTGTKFVHVPYKGNAPAMTDLIGGQITVIVDALNGVASFVKAGRIRAIGVASQTRSPLMPDVPPISDAVPGYELVGWLGIVAPAGTPPDRVAWLSKEIAAALNEPGVKQRLVQAGNEVVASTPEDFARFIQAEVRKYETITQSAGIKPVQ